MTFAFEIYRESDDAPLITAELVYVNVDLGTMKSAPLPGEVRSRVAPAA